MDVVEAMKYIRYDGQWVPADAFQRVPSRFPAIIRDGMEPLRNMADGKLYDSKSEFRRTTRAHGLIEVGNEQQTTARARLPKAGLDVAKAWEMVEQGYQPEPLAAIDDGDFAGVPTKML